jgi:D-alanyl-D-alanine carboxypeptidase
MKRRDFLKVLALSILGAGTAPEVFAEITRHSYPTPANFYDDQIKDYLLKMKNFNKPHKDDIYLDQQYLWLLKSTVKRLRRLQQTVGHGNFYLLSIDEAIRFSRNYSRIGSFTRAELDFLEMVFYEDFIPYGFFGDKPQKNLTDSIQKRDTVKIPRTGNYLYKGAPQETYDKIKKDLGDQVVLTSGIRSITKQMYLFLNKAYKSKGNLSLASRSLAPPGYSFHSIGDFDVGKIGFGVSNFTERFTTTDVYKKLNAYGYLKLRYVQSNLLGVRFEPWHIKVV